jgi:hypothetical protein
MNTRFERTDGLLPEQQILINLHLRGASRDAVMARRLSLRRARRGYGGVHLAPCRQSAGSELWDFSSPMR